MKIYCGLQVPVLLILLDATRARRYIIYWNNKFVDKSREVKEQLRNNFYVLFLCYYREKFIRMEKYWFPYSTNRNFVFFFRKGGLFFKLFFFLLGRGEGIFLIVSGE